jgi:hypothetical protein
VKLRNLSEEEFAAMTKRVRSSVGVSVGRVQQAGSTSRKPQSITAVAGKRGSIPVSSPYRSKWEAAYAANLELAKQAGVIKQWWYEPMSIWLPGKVRYRPDFMVQYPLGMERSLQIVEVKGWSRNRRDGLTRLKIAAALFPCFTWTLAYKVKGGGWMEETL